MSRFPKVSPQKATILPPMSPAPVIPGFSQMLHLLFFSFSSFSFPLGLCPFGKGLKSPPPPLLWHGPGEHPFKGKGVASTGLPRLRARPLRGSSRSGDCGRIHCSSWHPPLYPVPGYCLLCSKL